MLKNLGRMIWSHSRDMRVLNYPEAIIYEIYTAEGYLYMKYCKKKNEYSVDKIRDNICNELYHSKSESSQPGMLHNNLS